MTGFLHSLFGLVLILLLFYDVVCVQRAILIISILPINNLHYPYRESQESLA